MGGRRIRAADTADDDGRGFLHPPFIGPYRTGPGTEIPEIVCINLATRPDRRRRMEALLAGYPLHVLEASLHPEPREGCRLSHLSAIERARDRGFPGVMIVEDDILVVRDLSALPPFPRGWQLVYLGGLCTRIYEAPEPPSIWFRGDVYCNHAYIVREELYDEILARGRAARGSIDEFLVAEIHPRWKPYLPSDSFIVQRDDWSDCEGERKWADFTWPRAGERFMPP
jgi:hypothetical protein